MEDEWIKTDGSFRPTKSLGELRNAKVCITEYFAPSIHWGGIWEDKNYGNRIDYEPFDLNVEIEPKSPRNRITHTYLGKLEPGGKFKQRKGLISFSSPFKIL